MKFARIVFIAAGLWGVFVLTPVYFVADAAGRHGAAAIGYSQFFYGLFPITMAWHVAFLLIGWQPVRFRPLMIPSMLGKFGDVVTVVVLHGHARVSAADAASSAADLVLGVLFIVAFVAARRGAAPPLRITETERRYLAATRLTLLMVAAALMLPATLRLS